MVDPRRLLAAGCLIVLLAEPALARVGLPRAVQIELRVVARELAVSRRARLVASRAAVRAQADWAAASAENNAQRAELAERAAQARQVYHFWQARCVALEQQRVDLRERRRAWRRSGGAISPRQMPAVGLVEVPFRADGTRSGWEDGIGIRVAAGDWVRAAAPGTVAFSGELPAYGGVVILDHGLRVFTVYGGLAEPTMPLDAPVSVGARLGQAAPDGGGLVYFSVRRGRKALDPEDWHREADPADLPGE